MILGFSIRTERRWKITWDKQSVYCIVVASIFPEANILSLSNFTRTSTEEGEYLTTDRMMVEPTFHACCCLVESVHNKMYNA